MRAFVGHSSCAAQCGLTAQWECGLLLDCWFAASVAMDAGGREASFPARNLNVAHTARASEEGCREETQPTVTSRQAHASLSKTVSCVASSPAQVRGGVRSEGGTCDTLRLAPRTLTVGCCAIPAASQASASELLHASRRARHHTHCCSCHRAELHGVNESARITRTPPLHTKHE